MEKQQLDSSAVKYARASDYPFSLRLFLNFSFLDFMRSLLFYGLLKMKKKNGEKRDRELLAFVKKKH